MSLIAYDLDGVLIPDCDKFPNIGGLDEFYTMATNIIPIFNPQGEYLIITARPAEFRSVTYSWCVKYLNPMPVRLHHERLTYQSTAGKYKADILNSNPDITKYIESDPGIVHYLKNNVTTGCEIIHFSSYLETHFK